MGTWTQAERDALPKEDFGDPEKEAFPIKDQNDVDDAAKLIGHASNPDAVKRRIIKIIKRKGLKMPKSWVSNMTKTDTTPLSFGDIRTLLDSKLKNFDKVNKYRYYIQDVYPEYFVYQDWDANMLYKATYSISDGDITLGDSTAVIAQKVYTPLVQITFSFDDTEVSFSEASDDIVYRTGKIFEAGDYPDKDFSLTEEELKAAAEEFSPVEIDLEHTPTVLDGKLGKLEKVEVSEDGKTLFGTVALPKWFDQLLTDGKRKVSCTWNRTTKQLAKLAIVANPRIEDAALMSAFSKYQEIEEDKIEEENSGTFEAYNETASNDVKKDKTDKAKILKGAKANMAKTAETEEVKDPEGPTPEQIEARFAAMEADIKNKEREILKLRNAERRRNSEKLAEEQVVAHKAYPAEKEILVALFEQAMIDDEEDEKPTGLAVFGQAKTQATRLGALKALFNTRPDYELLLKENIQTDEVDGQVVYNKIETTKKDEVKMSAERKEALMSLTPLGQTTLTK